MAENKHFTISNQASTGVQVDSSYFNGPVYSSEDSGEIRACIDQESNLEVEIVGVPNDGSVNRGGYCGIGT